MTTTTRVSNSKLKGSQQRKKTEKKKNTVLNIWTTIIIIISGPLGLIIGAIAFHNSLGSGTTQATQCPLLDIPSLRGALVCKKTRVFNATSNGMTTQELQGEQTLKLSFTAVDHKTDENQWINRDLVRISLDQGPDTTIDFAPAYAQSGVLHFKSIYDGRQYTLWVSTHPGSCTPIVWMEITSFSTIIELEELNRGQENITTVEMIQELPLFFSQQATDCKFVDT